MPVVKLNRMILIYSQILFAIFGSAPNLFGQALMNVTELGTLAPIGQGNSLYQDVWGYVDESTGKE